MLCNCARCGAAQDCHNWGGVCERCESYLVEARVCCEDCGEDGSSGHGCDPFGA